MQDSIPRELREAGPYLPVIEAAKHLAVSRYRIYELIRQGYIPAIRLGDQQIRIPRDGLIRYLERQQLGPARRAI